VASALRAAAEQRDDELVNLTGPRVYHWQVRVAAAAGPHALTTHIEALMLPLRKPAIGTGS